MIQHPQATNSIHRQFNYQRNIFQTCIEYGYERRKKNPPPATNEMFAIKPNHTYNIKWALMSVRFKEKVNIFIYLVIIQGTNEDIK